MKILNVLLMMIFLSFWALAGETLTKPFMWKIEKDKQTSYLFGTIHVPAPEFSTLPLSITSVIDSCDGVRTELDMDAIDPMKMMPLMMRTDPKPLDKILSKELYIRTDNVLKGINPALSVAPFAEMKLWALSATLVLIEEQMKYLGLTPIDDVIFKYAKKQGKTVGGIETMEEQLGYFDKFTLDEQILFLESTLDYMAEHKEPMKVMKELYIKGDSKALLSFINDQYGDEKYKKLETKFMEELLYKRNVVMANRIDMLLKKDRSKSYLFAFGTMHFLDKKSVISHLNEKGYTVKRMN